MNNKKITIELESYADNEAIRVLLENVIKDNFRFGQKIKVEDIEE